MFCGGAGKFSRLRGAFSLLEVLVVVAVISLLVAILIPSLSTARRQARELVCQSNMRSIGQGWHSYLTAYSGSFLKNFVSSDTSDKETGQSQDINYGGKLGASAPYRGRKILNKSLGMPLKVEKGAEVFKCPLDRGSGFIRPSCFDAFGSSYFMNHMLVGPDHLTLFKQMDCYNELRAVSRRMGTVKDSQLANESKLILAAEYGWRNRWNPFGFDILDFDFHQKPNHHNVVFMDGHVEYVEIRRGIHWNKKYTVIPFRDQQVSVVDCQVEVLPPETP